MSVGPLVIEITCVCCLAAFLLHRYGNWRKQHPLVTFACFIAWYFSLMIIFILPLDVSSTSYRQCLRDYHNQYSTAAPDVTQNVTGSPASSLTSNDSHSAPAANVTLPPNTCVKPWSFVPHTVFPVLWRILYWTSQVLTWLLLPLMQSYTNAGEFTVAGKLKYSLIANAIYYGTYLLIFGVCLIYVSTRADLHFNGAQLKVLAITASNTWGLFLLVLLLGYGLVDVPRFVWNCSRRGHMLADTHFKIARLSTEKTEAEENLEDVMEDVKKAAETIRYNHPLRKHVDTILEKCPENVKESVSRNKDDYEDYNNPTETPTEKSLVRLHKKVINASQTWRRTQVQWGMLMDQAFRWEDIAQNEVSYKREFIRTFGKYDGVFRRCYSPAAEWYWQCWLRPWLLRLLAVSLALLSAMVVWSECLFFVRSPVLSFFAIFVQLSHAKQEYFNIEFVSSLTLSYLSVCAYNSLLKIRVFNYIYVAPYHQTNEYSLIFVGMFLCRLVPPMCLNFLGLIHMDTHITKANNLEETSYNQIMGHMDVIPFISSGFNLYFPMLILLLCIATYFHLGGRLLQWFGFQQFIGDDDVTQELVDEGKELVKRERRRRQREEDGETRRRTWQDRFGSPRRDTAASRDRGRAGGASHGRSAHSPDDNDQTGLLKDAEPVDYRAETPGGAYDNFSINQSAVSNFPASQSAAERRPPARTARPAGPPRGIFDDV